MVYNVSFLSKVFNFTMVNDCYLAFMECILFGLVGFHGNLCGVAFV